MRFLLFFSLCLISVWANDRYSAIVLPSKVQNVASLKGALARAYRNHIKDVSLGSPNSKHLVAILLDNNVVLPWTDSTKESIIVKAINELSLVGVSSAPSGRTCLPGISYASMLNACREHPTLKGKLTNVYLILDNVPDTSTYAAATQASNELVNKLHVQVYPLGIGPCINTQHLKRIAGPCHPLFGCHSPFSFYQSRTYDAIQKATIEEERSPIAKKHTIITSEGLTSAQLAITIVFVVVIGVLSMWCLVYSCCYLPRNMPEYTMWAEAVPEENTPIRKEKAIPSFVQSFLQQKQQKKSHIV